MKTLFAFLTGLLGGTIVGVLLSATVALTDRNYREYLMTEAEELDW